MNLQRQFRHAMQASVPPEVTPFTPFTPRFGHWIWLDERQFPGRGPTPASWFAPVPEGVPFTAAVFRDDFRLAETPVAVRVRHSGDVRYRISVNGEFAATGPLEAGGDFGKTDSPDWRLIGASVWTGRLKRGANAVVAEVFNRTLVQTDYSGGHASWFCEMELTYADGRIEYRGTGYNVWKGAVATGFGGFDYCNAAAETLGDYRTRDYNASAWSDAVILPPGQAGWEQMFDVGSADLFTAAIPAIPATGKFPLRVPFGVPQRLRFDFPTEITGYFQLTVRGRRCMRLQIEYAEIPEVPHGVETYVLRDGVQTFRSLRMNAMRTVWVIVTTGSFDSMACEPLTILEAGAEFVSYPVVNRGEFTCSDARFNELTECCRWTLQLCRQRLHLDSPIHQEGLGCTADYMIESMLNYYTSGDPTLTALDIRRTALLLRQQEGRMFHTLFALLWIRMTLDYYHYTGDAALVREVRDAVDLELDLFATYAGPEGLVSAAPNYMFIDWVWQGKFNLHHPPAQIGMGPATAFYYGALQDGVAIARLTGDNARATELERRGAAVKAAFHRHLWSEERGLFRDGVTGISPVPPSGWIPADDPELESYSRHTGVLAAAVGLVEGEAARSMLRRTLADDTLVDMQPYFHYYCFEALRRTGLFAELGWPRCKRWFALIKEHPEALKEAWNAGDYSHAWGCAPVVAAFRTVAGITPEEPGWKRVRVAPVDGIFRSWQCRVPTPFGTIAAARSADGHGTVTLPPGVSGVLIRPEGTREIEAGGSAEWR